VQLMVVKTKTQAKEEFGRRLNDWIEKTHKVPKRGRVKWLYDRLKEHAGHKEVVVYEAVRKWLAGMDIPEEANKPILCAAIGASYNELFGGDDASRPDADRQIIALLKALSPDEKKLAIGYLHGITAGRRRAS
jgi:hypothetical protein